MKLSVLGIMLLALVGSGLYVGNAIAGDHRENKGWHDDDRSHSKKQSGSRLTEIPIADFLDLGDGGHAVDPRHLQVHHGRVELLLLDQLDGLLAVERTGGLEAPHLNSLGDGVQKLLLVIHQQYLELLLVRHVPLQARIRSKHTEMNA